MSSRPNIHEQEILFTTYWTYCYDCACVVYSPVSSALPSESLLLLIMKIIHDDNIVIHWKVTKWDLILNLTTTLRIKEKVESIYPSKVEPRVWGCERQIEKGGGGWWVWWRECRLSEMEIGKQFGFRIFFFFLWPYPLTEESPSPLLPTKTVWAKTEPWRGWDKKAKWSLEILKSTFYINNWVLRLNPALQWCHGVMTTSLHSGDNPAATAKG